MFDFRHEHVKDTEDHSVVTVAKIADLFGCLDDSYDRTLAAFEEMVDKPTRLTASCYSCGGLPLPDQTETQRQARNLVRTDKMVRPYSCLPQRAELTIPAQAHSSGQRWICAPPWSGPSFG